MGMDCTRRDLGRWMAGGLCAAISPRLRAGALSPTMLGANTAITGYGLVEAIDKLRELGFPVIEIHPMGTPEPTADEFPGYEFDRLDKTQKRDIRKALEGFDRVTAHLPYTDLKTFSRFGPVRDFSRERVEIALEGSAYFGAKLCVLHAEVLEGSRREQTWAERIRLYRGWGDIARRHGMQIALETAFPASVKEFVAMIQEIDHSHIGATLDVGHQARYAELTARVKPEDKGTPAGILAYNDINEELVERLGPKLFHLHIHDIEPTTWAEHKPMIHEFIDYPRLLRKLAEINYKGSLVFEIGGDPAKMPEYLADAKRKLEGYLKEIA